MRAHIRIERHGAMASHPRLILQLAAAMAAAAMMSAATPAVATEIAVTKAVSVKPVSQTIKHHTVRHTRLAASAHRRVSFTPGDTECPGGWCKRQFVLMVGIGY
jgi:ABC-type uncharacterized transport system auxiliary subunit